MRCDVRKKYSQMRAKKLASMLTPLRKFVVNFNHFYLPRLSTRRPDGTIVLKRDNPVVPSAVLNDVYLWMSQGATFEDVVDRLRPRTVSRGYTYSCWKPGTVAIQLW